MPLSTNLVSISLLKPETLGELMLGFNDLLLSENVRVLGQGSPPQLPHRAAADPCLGYSPTLGPLCLFLFYWLAALGDRSQPVVP